MDIKLHPLLERRRRQLPAAIAELGRGQTAFLVPLAGDAYLYPWEMFVLLQHMKKWSVRGDAHRLAWRNERRRAILQGLAQRTGPRSPKWRRTAGIFIRDLAVFALSGARWRADEIMLQLHFMGLPLINSKQKKFNICCSVRKLLIKAWLPLPGTPDFRAEAVFGHLTTIRCDLTANYNPLKRERRRMLRLQGCPLSGRPVSQRDPRLLAALFRLTRIENGCMVTCARGVHAFAALGTRNSPSHLQNTSLTWWYRGRNGLPADRRCYPGRYGFLRACARAHVCGPSALILDYGTGAGPD